MSEIPLYKLIFPQTQVRLTKQNVTFTIWNIKSRNVSVVYFKFYGYDLRGELVEEHTGERWVITSNYEKQEETWDLSVDPLEIDSYKMELYCINIDSENPLYFNKLVLNSGEPLVEYHTPHEEIKNINIGFHNNTYINLYDDTETYLQIIRPYKEDLSTEQLTKSKLTVLAPHLPNETEFDDPISILYELMYMKEQIIGVEK